MRKPHEQPLTKVGRGFRGRVTRVSGGQSELVSSFGIYAGAGIELKQKRPSYVIQVEQSEIALESSVAREIWVVRGE